MTAETDPYEGEPPEDELPPKPAVEMPAESDSDPGEEELPEDAFMSAQEAQDNVTIDDAESYEEPHDPSTLDIAED